MFACVTSMNPWGLAYAGDLTACLSAGQKPRRYEPSFIPCFSANGCIVMNAKGRARGAMGYIPGRVRLESPNIAANAGTAGVFTAGETKRANRLPLSPRSASANREMVEAEGCVESPRVRVAAAPC